MENLLVFICQNQNEAEQLAVISTNVDAHRYFIIVGFEINKQSSFFLETDSFLILEKIDLKNKEQMARLCLLYSLPNFENILIINNNKMFVEKEVKHVFLNFKNTLDYAILLSRSDYALNGLQKEVDDVNVLDYGQIMQKAMNEEVLTFQEFKIALKELLPAVTLNLSERSTMFLAKEIKEIILIHNKEYKSEVLDVLLDETAKEKCLLFSTSDFDKEKYTTKLVCGNEIVVYFYF
jgi:hypothetical protein